MPRRTAAVPLITAALLLGTAGSAFALPIDDDEPIGQEPNALPAAALTVSPNPALVTPELTVATAARVVDVGGVLNRNAVSFSAAGSTDSDGSIAKYEWDLDGNGSFERTTTTPRTSRTYAAPGLFAVKVRVTDDQGGRDVATRQLRIHRAPRAAIAANPATLLVGQAAGLSAAGSTDDDGIAKHEWDLDGNGTFETATGASPAASASFTTLGRSTVRVKVTDVHGATSTAATQLTVHRAPDAAFSATPTPAAVGEQVVFDGSASSDDEPIANYTWDLDGDGTFETNSGASPRAARTFAQPGTVTARLRVTDSRGVQDEVTRELTVLARPPADTVAPVVRIVAPSTRMSRSGRVTLSIACPAGERLCSGRVSLRSTGARSAAVGSRSYRLAGGERIQVRVLLSRSAQRAVRRQRRLPVRVSAVTRDAAGNVGTARRSLRIRR